MAAGCVEQCYEAGHQRLVHCLQELLPQAEADVNVVSEERMRYAVETLGGISIEMMSSGAFFSEIEDDYEAVKSIIGRHPMNQFEVRGFLESRDVKDPEAMMEQMKKDEAIHVIDYKGILTFRLK